MQRVASPVSTQTHPVRGLWRWGQRRLVTCWRRRSGRVDEARDFGRRSWVKGLRTHMTRALPLGLLFVRPYCLRERDTCFLLRHSVSSWNFVGRELVLLFPIPPSPCFHLHPPVFPTFLFSTSVPQVRSIRGGGAVSSLPARPRGLGNTARERSPCPCQNQGRPSCRPHCQLDTTNQACSKNGELGYDKTGRSSSTYSSPYRKKSWTRCSTWAHHSRHPT